MSSRRVGFALVTGALLVGLLPAAALAHEERASRFPPGDGQVPTHRTLEEAADVLVVCKEASAGLIADIDDAELRAFNEQLLEQCGFAHIQAAVDAVEAQQTNIYVLPGTYREQPSWDVNAPCADDYDGGVVDYDQIVSCGEVINLVTVAGDDPDDDDIVCDNPDTEPLCDLQIEGTGAEPTDTVLRGGFRDDGDWIKHNGIKADRADGFYLENMTFELFRENAVYVHETDGYVLDEVVGRYNDLYALLTFTSDHGVIKDCETHHNGDSGIYPGSAADVNADSDERPPLDRWAVEIFGCETHHNALGFSGTAGNSVYFHDNEVHSNSAGYVTDSFVPGHPGMPQDHAWLEGNDIHGNNVNFYENVQGDDAPCQREKPADRGYEDGVVCPVFPVPVGTGVMIAGGNHNLVTDNLVYDNWRQGVMLFWVPAALREEFAGGSEELADTLMGQANQFDTSNGNGFTGNLLGAAPDGTIAPNGVDFWWDEQGIGNCWQGNESASGEVTHNVALPTGLPDCDSGGSLSPVGNAAKSAAMVPCATYDREDNPDPAGCDWFDTPQEPASSDGGSPSPDDADGEDEGVASDGDDQPFVPAGADGDGGVLPATGGGLAAVLLGLTALTLAAGLRRRAVLLAPTATREV